MGASSVGGLPRQRFRSRLASRPILVDGGMGTLLFSRGVPQRACLEELVATHPDLVGAAHREYLEAGAELIETLSFGANRHRLATWGLEGRAADLNRRARGHGPLRRRRAGPLDHAERRAAAAA